MAVVYAANGKRDFHQLERLFDQRLEQLQRATWRHEANRRRILEYLLDCKRGLAKSRGRNARVGKSTLYRIVGLLELLSEKWIDKDFGAATKQDWRDFYVRMEDDAIRNEAGKPYRPSSKAKNYKTVRKFLNWCGLGLYCDDWDTSEEQPTQEYLTRPEVERLLEAASVKLKCVVMILFDGGLRAEEFANLGWLDLRKPDGRQYRQATVRKETSKTKRGRVVSLWLATDHIDAYQAALRARGAYREDSFLYEGDYQSLLKALQRLGKRALGKPVSPHTLRHSSATYYASVIKTYQNFCFRYGWSLKSGMAQRYWHPSADDEIASQAKDHEIARFRTEFERFRVRNESLNSEIAQLRQELEAFKQACFTNFIESGQADKIYSAYERLRQRPPPP